ncbi:unnamed protein product [Chilo suppressalis]|uniref:Transporter n=1 Tax=Chilo suppressalis TaxID=168631 RepID=A0ABN8L867_CHISP|nr:unnamed protein product [Chilo suppressalis]
MSFAFHQSLRFPYTSARMLRFQTAKLVCDCIKTQLCTVAVSLSLFNSSRLPREAFRYGAVPFLVVYSFWLLVVGLPTVLLQLAMGQLSQQDAVGVWRAVPMLRGVGHLKLLTSYLCCIYNVMYVALAMAFLIWIGKGSFPLKDCTRLRITPRGYENKMNASECFNTTFLAPFTDYPQYLGIMGILIFVLWFFVPMLLYRLRKSLKTSLNVLAPLIVIIAVVLCTFVSNAESLNSLFESCEHWMPISQPYIWYSTLVQALMSTQLLSGFLISGGGTIYRHSDVRWTSMSIITINLLSSWIWVLIWESIGGTTIKDTSFVAILVLIYQSSVSEKRTKEWPLIAFAIVFISGVITLLTLLFPVYDKLHRLFGDNWRFYAAALSAIGTAFSVAVLARSLEIVTILDELIVPVLAVFTTTVEVVGFAFIYGWFYLSVDIEFLTGNKLPCFWAVSWWTIPILIIGVTGWWLRTLIRASWSQGLTLWPLVGVFVGILIMMVLMAAVAVAKEEQFNLVSKIAAAFSSSRLWGPEEPMARYVWMSQRYANEVHSSDTDLQSEPINYSQIVFNTDHEHFGNEWFNKPNDLQNSYNIYSKTPCVDNYNTVFNDISTIYAPKMSSTSRNIKKSKEEEKFRSPNVCIAKNEISGTLNCNCNRHFTLNVPDLRKCEVTTCL